jgi:hypothetical protein
MKNTVMIEEAKQKEGCIHRVLSTHGSKIAMTLICAFDAIPDRIIIIQKDGPSMVFFYSGRGNTDFSSYADYELLNPEGYGLTRGILNVILRD